MRETEPERFASLVVAQRLGVQPRFVDRAIDYELDYPDGSVGVLEVTTIADQAAMQSESLIAKLFGGSWRVEGLKWSWMVWVGPGVNPHELIVELPDALRACEAAHVQMPDALRDYQPDYEWIRWDDVRATAMGETNDPGAVYVVPDLSDGGAVPDTAELLDQWIDNVLLLDPNIVRHIDKLVAETATQHHLFVRVAESRMGFQENYLLNFTDLLPAVPPAVPGSVDGLWLGGRWSGGILVWLRRTGWERLHLRH